MENENYNPYIEKPGQEERPPEPYNAKRNVPNGLARASMILGIIGVVSVFTFMVYPAMILGSLAVILAILSKGAEKKMNSSATGGLVTGIVALSINMVLIVGSFYLIFTVPQMRQEFNDAYEQMYGESFDDTLESIKEGTYEGYNY